MNAEMFIDGNYIGDIDLPVSHVSWRVLGADMSFNRPIIVSGTRLGSWQINSKALRSVFECFEDSEIRLHIQIDTWFRPHDREAEPFIADLWLRAKIVNPSRNDFELIYEVTEIKYIAK